VQSGVHPINRMTDTTLGDGPAPEATASVKLRLAKEDVSGEIAKKHFDAFETDFFQQGEDGAGVLIDADRFDEGDGAGKNFLPMPTIPLTVIATASCHPTKNTCRHDTTLG